MAQIMTQEEFNEFSYVLAKTSIWAILIPFAAAMVSYMTGQGHPFFWFIVAQVTTGAGYHWAYTGPREDKVFMPLAIIAIALFLVISLGFITADKANKRNTSYEAGLVNSHADF